MTTATGRRRASPLKRFLATETSGAAVLVLAVVVALFWVNVSATTYRSCGRSRCRCRSAMSASR